MRTNQNTLIKIGYGFFLVLISTAIAIGQSLELPMPVAHYPLDVTMITRPPDLDKQWVPRPFDVSGNGQHGTFTNERAFSSIPFLSANDEPRLLKTRSNAAWLSIPDPYAGYDFSEGFAISFWIYWDATDRVDSLIKVPNMRVYRDGDRVKIRLKLKQGSTNTLTTFQGATLGAQGWYFIGITAANNSLSIWQNVGLGSEITSTTYTTTGTIQRYTTFPETRLFDQLCSGAMANVRFFNKEMLDGDLTEYLDADLSWSEFSRSNGDLDYDYAPNFNFETGVYSKYLLNGNSDDAINRKGDESLNGTLTGFTAYANRFGDANSSIHFLTHGRVDLTGSNFTSMADYLNGYDGKKGMTISFWTYLSGTQSHAFGGDYPFNKTTDARFSIIYGLNNDSKPVFGIEHVKDILGVWRVARKMPGDVDPTDKNWFLWFNRPANLPESGWYHVVCVYESKITKILVTPYEGTMTGAFCYMGMEDQDASKAKYFGFGDPQTGQSNLFPAEVLDDVRIYNWPLTMRDAVALNIFETEGDPDAGGGGRMMADDTRPVGSGIDSLAVFERTPNIYPNPASSELTVDLGSPQEESLITFEDAIGRVVYSKSHSTPDGLVHFQNVKSITGSSGLYFIKMRTNSSTVVKKLIVN